MADRLEMAGERAWRPREEWITAVNADGETEILPGSQFRHIQFLPLVMQHESRAWARNLQNFLDLTPNARLWTFTLGERVPVSDVRERVRAILHRLSDRAPRWRKWGMDTVARRMEFTIDEGEGGMLTYHVHAHVILVPDRFRKKDEFAKLISDIRESWGSQHYSHDDGIIRDSREVSKYLAKVESKEDRRGIGVSELPTSEFLLLAKAVHGLSLSRALGSFRRLQQRYKREGVSPRRLGEEGWALVRKMTVGARQERNGSGNTTNIVLGSCVAALRKPILRQCILVQNFTSLEDLLRLRGEAVSSFLYTPARHLRSEKGGADPPWSDPPLVGALVTAGGKNGGGNEGGR